MDEGGLLPIARTLIALIGVCALAWVALGWLSRRGFGTPRPQGQRRLQLLDRLPLGPRRQLYLVQADSRVFLVGAADAGTPRLIAELGRTDVAAGASEASSPASR